MLLNFTTNQIAFALYGIFSQLGATGSETKFKAHIIDLIESDSTPDHVHTVDVSQDILIKCYINVSTSPYGVTTDIAEGLLDSLRTQLVALGTPEAVATLTEIGNLKVKDTEYAASRILACIEQILA